MPNDGTVSWIWVIGGCALLTAFTYVIAVFEEMAKQ